MNINWIAAFVKQLSANNFLTFVIFQLWKCSATSENISIRLESDLLTIYRQIGTEFDIPWASSPWRLVAFVQSLFFFNAWTCEDGSKDIFEKQFWLISQYFFFTVVCLSSRSSITRDDFTMGTSESNNTDSTVGEK